MSLSSTVSKDNILNTCLAQAARTSWATVRLHDVAKDMGVTLREIQSLVRQKDDVAELLFDRADEAMLRCTEESGFEALSVCERLSELILTWLETLSPHKRAVRDIMAYKLEPGHVHLQAHGITRISRTVQWVMEAAQVESQGVRRAIEESVLTSIYLRTVGTWLLDCSPDNKFSKQALQRMLQRTERVAEKLNSFG